MSDNMNKGFDQVASFQKLWTDSFANMASVWSQFSPGSPPSDEMRKVDTIERRGQTSTTKAQKPAATTGAKHSPSK